MAVPVLFVESVEAEQLEGWITGGVWPEKWQQSGLAEHFADVRNMDSCAVSNIKGGPAGVHGVTVAVWPEGAEPPSMVFYAGQEWHRAGPGVWMRADGIPRPVDLQRHYLGAKSVQAVQLVNGSVWEIPVLRQPTADNHGLVPWGHAANLPQSVRRDPETSGWEMRVLPQYEKLWEASRRWFEFFSENDSAQVSWADVFEYLQQVLSLNYRYTHLLHAVFGEHWVTTENVFDVVKLSCGYHIVERYLIEKKNTGTMS